MVLQQKCDNATLIILISITVCLRPLQVDNIFVFIRQVALVPAYCLRHQQQVDLLTLKVVSESRVTWVTSVPILVFLGLDLGPMCATDVRQKHRFMPPPIRGGSIIN